MRRTRLAAVAACALAAAVGSLASAPAVAAGPNAIVTDHWAGPLHAPRGLKFGPDGYLYVAEGGVGGSDPVPDNCGGTVPGETVPPPIGPYTGSPTGSQISRIDTQGHVTPWVVGFPSSKTSMQSGFLPSGVADVAFVGDTMYAVLAGAGCTHGVPSRPNGVVRVNPDRSWTMIADLSAWQHAHPVAHPEIDDFEPDGTWYSMIAVRGDLYAVEPNHGDIVRVTTGGQISRVVDTSARLGHVVPTALAYHGNFYFGNLSTFNFAPGAPINTSNVWKMTPSGQLKVDEAGFNMVLGLAFDNRARMYVLEMTTGAAQPVPFTGRVTRVSPSGKREVIADGSDGLVFPTGIAIGPDGALYVSNQGFGPEFVFGPGSITRIEILD